MPFPIAAAIAGAASLASSAIGSASNANMNKKNMEYQQSMYQKQYDDNLKMWNMSNSYNSPEQQMQRLQAAGLNPNLIYGSGGQTGGTASPISAPTPQSMSFKPTAIDLGRAAGTAFDKYFDYQVKNLQIDNLKAQNDVILQEAALKKAQTDNISFNTGLNTESRPYDLQARQQKAYLLGAQHVIKENEADIILATKPATIQAALEKLSQIRLGNQLTREQISKIRNDQEIQQMNIDLMKNGIRPTDAIYWRMLGTAAAKVGITIK